MKQSFIEQYQGNYGVVELCECLGLSPSTYYRWNKSEPSQHKQDDEAFKCRILELHKQAKGRYGHRPIYYHLEEEHMACGRDRTLRLMKELGIEGIQKKAFKPMRGNQCHDFGYRPNLLKELGNPSACDQVWVADTTFIATEDGWMYLATVMDLYSRRILGWSLSWSNGADLVCQAFKNAVITRGTISKGILHHSDRGSTYSSRKYQLLLERHGIKQSMSAKGNCYDNAAMESFYGRYKSSTVRGQCFDNEGAVQKNVFDYIEVFYNRFRKHASLGYKNPIQFEQQTAPPMGSSNNQACTTHN